MWHRSKAMSTSRPPTAIGDCWESVPASWSLCVSARGAISFRWGGGSQLGAVLESGASGTLVSGNFAAGRLRWRCGNIANGCSRNSIYTMASNILRWIGERRRATARLGRWLAGLLLTCCLPLLAGMFVRSAGTDETAEAAAVRHGTLSGYAGASPGWFGLPDT